jgi:hypothetical protein
VGLYDPDYDIDAFALESLGTGQHGVSFANTRGGAQENFKLATRASLGLDAL